MKMQVSMDIIAKYGQCPICGSDKIGNGSRLVIEDKSFFRSCKNCGWKVSGYVDDDGTIVEEENNSQELKKKRV